MKNQMLQMHEIYRQDTDGVIIYDVGDGKYVVYIRKSEGRIVFRFVVNIASKISQYCKDYDKCPYAKIIAERMARTKESKVGSDDVVFEVHSPKNNLLLLYDVTSHYITRYRSFKSYGNIGKYIYEKIYTSKLSKSDTLLASNYKFS